MNSTPLKTLNGVNGTDLLAEARDLIDSVSSWRKCPSYSFNVPQSSSLKVDMYVTDHNDDYWVARRNDFSELSGAGRKSVFNALMLFSVGSTLDLAKCHTEYEKYYISELNDFKLTPYVLENIPDGYKCISYLAELYYGLQWPLKHRKFCNLIFVAVSADERRGYVISLAVDPSVIPGASSDPDHVAAQYTSVEEVVYDPEKDTLQWTMTTASDAKGNVPKWLAKRTINGVVAKDVPHFLKWASSKV